MEFDKYLKENNLLLTQIDEDVIPQKDLEKIINNIKIFCQTK